MNKSLLFFFQSVSKLSSANDSPEQRRYSIAEHLITYSRFLIHLFPWTRFEPGCWPSALTNQPPRHTF